MTRRAWRAGALGSLLALACATPPEAHWSRPGATAEELRRDRAACLREAEAGIPAQASDRAQSEVGGNLFLRCMRDRGWTQTRDAE